jgi:23S rRNA (cytidine1920-2'-O)/16S rRNA (cytidine1409-2'-O)-methyltransferase
MKTRLDKELVRRSLAPSRTRAQALIRDGFVLVGGVVIRDPDAALSPEDPIRLIGIDHPWVSRGGVKLAHALDHFGIDPRGKVALDIGASTGGFTDVLLQRGARLVYALDVGHDQLAERLRQDVRVMNMEGRHINALSPGDLMPLPEIIVIDVSFISLTKILAQVNNLCAEGGVIVALIKPQFEVGRAAISKGIVRDPALHEKAIADVVHAAREAGLIAGAPIPSPLEGGDGNKEFLIMFHSSERSEKVVPEKGNCRGSNVS